MRRFQLVPILVGLCILAGITSSSAQGITGCAQTDLTDPPRVAYECANGLVLEAEAAALLGDVTQGNAGRPASVELDGRATLIEVDPGSGAFQIQTPHAIAAVRGTEYIVDVTADMTSVFVIRGVVAVSRADGSDTVLLDPGFGVDVSDGNPLAPLRWGTARAEALLARFAR